MAPSLVAVVDDPGDRSEAELLAAHAGQLASVIDAVGRSAAAEAAGRPEATIDAIAEGDVETAGDLDIETVAAVLSLAEGARSATDMLDEARDELLLGMTTGVLNVDVVASEVDVDVGPTEVQGMLEGRHPTTLREYAALQRFVASRAP